MPLPDGMKNYHQLKQDRIQKQNLESQFTKKYGKGLSMLQKMGGYSVGKGIGKNETGVVEPILPDADVGREKEGGGQHIHGSVRQHKRTHKPADEEDEQHKLKRQRILDQEDVEFMSLLGRKHTIKPKAQDYAH